MSADQQDRVDERQDDDVRDIQPPVDHAADTRARASVAADRELRREVGADEDFKERDQPLRERWRVRAEG